MVYLRNKPEIILTEDSVSKIPSGINSSIASQDNYNSEFPSGINSPIPLGTNYNSTMPSGDTFSITPRDMSKTPSGDTYNSIPTNSKVHLVNPKYLSTNPSMSPSMVPSIVSTNLPKFRNYMIIQQIYNNIFNGKQEPKDLKRYDCNGNHWRKAMENWTAAISAA